MQQLSKNSKKLHAWFQLESAAKNVYNYVQYQPHARACAHAHTHAHTLMHTHTHKIQNY